MADENDSGWLDAVAAAGKKFGQSAAQYGADWLDVAVAQEQEQAAANEMGRFRQGPAYAWRQRNMVERDQNVGATPYSPRAGTPAAGGGGADGAGMMGGMGEALASPFGMLMLVGTAVGLYYMATNN